MAKNPEPVPPVTGRTYADVIAEALQILGKLGVPAIIVGALLFAFYMYSQMIAEAQLRADKQNQEKLQQAQQALIETYNSIGDLSKQQISNVKELLALNQQVAQTTEEGRLELERLREKADEQERLAEEARIEADEVRELARAAQAKLDALNEEMALRKKEAEKELVNLLAAKKQLQTEHTALQEEMAKKKEVLDNRARKIEELRAQLDILARQVAEHDVAELTAPETARVATQYLEQEASREPGRLLLSFASDPTADTFQALEALDGVKDETLLPLLRNGSGFAFWVKVTDPENPDTGAYLGSVSQTDQSYADALAIEMDEGRVLDLTGARAISAFKTRNIEDWYKAKAFILITGIDYGEDEEEEFDEIRLNVLENTWTLGKWIAADLPEGTIEPVYQKEKALRFVGLESLRRGEFGSFSGLLDYGDFQQQLALAERMSQRANEFDAEKLPGIEQVKFPPHLRKEFTAFANSVVRREPAAENHLAVAGGVAKESLGVIAAHLLSEGLTVNAISRFLSDMKAQTVPQPIDGAVWIEASALSGLEDGAVKRLNFKFLPDGAEGWLLTEFVVDVSPEQAVSGVEDRYWVVIGSFKDRGKAQGFADKVNAESGEVGAFVGIFNPSTGYWPVIAGYGNRSEAEKLREKVLKLKSVSDAYLAPA